MKDSQIIKRLRLGLIFHFSSTWMGGIIYIQNLIKSLDSLDDKEKPEIFLFYKPELKKFLDEITYPYITLIEWNFPPIVKGIIKSLIARKNLFIDKILKTYSLDAIYPLHDFPVRTKSPVKLVAWCADLQHKHHPGFFTKMQIIGRDLRLSLTLRNSDYLIVSSQAVLDDFIRFFKPGKDIKIRIFHFASVIDNLANLNIADLRSKYNLPEKYFLISNQFHKHKNHKVVLLSLLKLNDMGVRVHLAFTGKFPGAVESPYLAELHRIIEENKLENQISLLGIIPRNDQLQIMRNSQAVIQPSLFEGWSTVIEDAKSLQVPVIASDLAVNIEQLGETGVYFDALDPDKLASILSVYPERNLKDTFYENSTDRIHKAARNFLEIIKD